MTDQEICWTRADRSWILNIVIFHPIALLQALTKVPANRIRSSYPRFVWIDQMDCLH